MGELSETTAKRIGKLVRMFGSPNEHEANNALLKLRRLLPEEHLSFNDLATVIENADGEIEERKYTDADMASVANQMKERGEKEGYEKAKRERTLPPEFYDNAGEPRWYEIASYCYDNREKLRSSWDKQFLEGEDHGGPLPGRVARFGAPTDAMKPIVLGIFISLGGIVPADVQRKYPRRRS